MQRWMVVLLFLWLCSPAGAWVRVSVLPGPLKQLETDVRHQDLLFAVTSDSLFRSIDGGRKWIKTDLKGDGQIVIHPANSDVYALFNEIAGGGSVVSRKLWVSKNQGATFQLVQSLDLTKEPLPERLYGDRDDIDGLFATDHAGRSLQSNDGGKHWKFLNTPSGIKVFQIYTSPLNSKVIYLSAEQEMGSHAGSRILLISHDRGKTWTLLSSDNAACPATTFYDDASFHRILVSDCDGTKTLAIATRTKTKVLRISSIVSVPQNFAGLFALQNGETAGVNLLMSTNGGDAWSKQSGMEGTITQVQVLNDPIKWVVVATRSGGIYRQKLSDFASHGKN